MRGPLLDGAGGRLEPMLGRLAPFGVGAHPLIAPRQVHGAAVVPSLAENALPNQPDADGILLTRGMEGSLRVADCAPVLVLPSEDWARENQPWALLLHSGYKGTVLNIVRAGLEAAERLGRGAAASASAWVGPCISGDNYPRMMEEWTKRGLDTFAPENVREADGRFFFDIAGQIRRQLLDCGLDGARIHLCRLDTVTSPVCYSYRNGDRTDRMFLHVQIS